MKIKVQTGYILLFSGLFFLYLQWICLLNVIKPENTTSTKKIFMSNFTTEFQKGILSKKLFLESKEIENFIEWLVPYIKGVNDLKKYGFKYKSFKEAIKDYEWGEDKNFNDTYNKFQKWRKELKKEDNSKNQQTCLEILKWGGVTSSNKKKIEVRNNLNEFLQSVKELVSQEEIIIYDLNPNYINSGFTKIFAAFMDDFIMYDGRVGSAICNLVASYLEDKVINKMPEELNFGWGMGQNKNTNRDPNKKSKQYRFKEITGNRNFHFISNIKANWLLVEIAKQVDLDLDIKDQKEKVFALQTALFVIGAENPVEKNGK